MGNAPSDSLEKMHEAGRILLENLSNPPSIRALSHLVGINETDLKIQFKRVFRTSIYALVKKHRMNRAVILLQEKQLTISEIAWSLGYKHPTHFSAAFKKEMGCTPREFQK